MNNLSKAKSSFTKLSKKYSNTSSNPGSLLVAFNKAKTSTGNFLDNVGSKVVLPSSKSGSNYDKKNTTAREYIKKGVSDFVKKAGKTTLGAGEAIENYKQSALTDLNTLKMKRKLKAKK